MWDVSMCVGYLCVLCVVCVVYGMCVCVCGIAGVYVGGVMCGVQVCVDCGVGGIYICVGCLDSVVWGVCGV